MLSFPHMAWLEFSDVSVCVRGQELLHSLSFALEKNESLALIGPSGGGKSLLLKVLAGLVPVHSGRYSFNEIPFSHSDKETRRQTGMSFQRGGLFDSLTVVENLLFPLREVLGLEGKEASERATNILAEVGLEGTENLFIHEISGGMQKRLGVARALLLSPSLLLCDDPTAGLDPVTSREIIELILEMKLKYGMTIVLSTSELSLAYRCDKVGFLNDGRFLDIARPGVIQTSEIPEVHQFTHGLLEGPLAPEGR